MRPAFFSEDCSALQARLGGGRGHRPAVQKNSRGSHLRLFWSDIDQYSRWLTSTARGGLFSQVRYPCKPHGCRGRRSCGCRSGGARRRRTPLRSSSRRSRCLSEGESEGEGREREREGGGRERERGEKRERLTERKTESESVSTSRRSRCLLYRKKHTKQSFYLMNR